MKDKINSMMNSCKTDLAKLICADFRKSAFLNINIDIYFSIN